MTSAHPAGGSRTLIGILSTFALVGGVVGFQNAAFAEEQAALLVGSRGLGVAPERGALTVAPVAEPAPAPVAEQPAVVEAPAPAAPAAEPPPAPAPVPAPPSGTTGGSGG